MWHRRFESPCILIWEKGWASSQWIPTECAWEYHSIQLALAPETSTLNASSFRLDSLASLKLQWRIAEESKLNWFSTFCWDWGPNPSTATDTGCFLPSFSASFSCHSLSRLHLLSTRHLHLRSPLLEIPSELSASSNGGGGWTWKCLFVAGKPSSPSSHVMGLTSVHTQHLGLAASSYLSTWTHTVPFLKHSSC